MLSILIPVYNYDVTVLVSDLHNQISQSEAPAEIIVMEDGSNNEFLLSRNEKITKLGFCRYFGLKKNVGRSQIRNMLAEKAVYDFLLFIDGDSLIETNYLKNYLETMNNSTEVVYGGRKHPADYQNTSNLRWKYGIEVEDKTARERRKKPYLSLIFNNTVIRKKTFLKIGFETELTKYGHEDTLLAFELKKQHAKVIHMDNAVLHGEIDSSEIFIAKTLSGLENLKVLYERKRIAVDFVKMLKVYRSINKLGLTWLFASFYAGFNQAMRRNLTSDKSSLLVFSLFKIAYFCKINIR